MLIAFACSGVALGHASARQSRAQAISTPSDPQEAKGPRVVLGYDTYFGIFRLNDQAGTITPHLDGSIFTEDLRKDFRRSFTVDGGVFSMSFTNTSPGEAAVTRTPRFPQLK